MADEHLRTRPEPVPANGPPDQRPRPAGAAKEKSAGQKEHGEPKDVFREVVETFVFVIVLVLLLKTFVAEAFVIPTGSMATTLYGYHRDVTCPKCGYGFAVNRSREADDQEFFRQPVIGCTCPNCRYQIQFQPDVQAPNWNQP